LIVFFSPVGSAFDVITLVAGEPFGADGLIPPEIVAFMQRMVDVGVALD
jgi:hypothetical protein